MLNKISQTIRSKSYFNFTSYLSVLPDHKKKIDYNFLCWFVGFTEGDGSFTSSFSKNTKNYRNFFLIVQKDPKVLYYIKNNLGFGLVSQRKDGYFTYYVGDQQNIERLIRIFNGNLVLQKVHSRFSKLFRSRRSKHFEKVKLIPFNTKFRESFFEDAWLTGFIDAEGCFSITWKKDKSKEYGSFQARVTITQKNAFAFIVNLRKFFGLDFKKTNTKTQQFSIQKKTTLLEIVKYLKAFPLKSNKIISFKRWNRLVTFKESFKPPYSEKAKLKLFRLIKSINNW